MSFSSRRTWLYFIFPILRFGQRATWPRMEKKKKKKLTCACREVKSKENAAFLPPRAHGLGLTQNHKVSFLDVKVRGCPSSLGAPAQDSRVDTAGIRPTLALSCQGRSLVPLLSVLAPTVTPLSRAHQSSLAFPSHPCTSSPSSPRLFRGHLLPYRLCIFWALSRQETIPCR